MVIYSTTLLLMSFYKPISKTVFFRHRKRWSQCMYLYYLLGFIGVEKKIRKIEDTFILALDGDVDFQPKAAEALLERMLRNDKVGAACGRIHPVGKKFFFSFLTCI